MTETMTVLTAIQGRADAVRNESDLCDLLRDLKGLKCNPDDMTPDELSFARDVYYGIYTAALSAGLWRPPWERRTLN